MAGGEGADDEGAEDAGADEEVGDDEGADELVGDELAGTSLAICWGEPVEVPELDSSLPQAVSRTPPKTITTSIQ